MREETGSGCQRTKARERGDALPCGPQPGSAQERAHGPAEERERRERGRSLLGHGVGPERGEKELGWGKSVRAKAERG